MSHMTRERILETNERMYVIQYTYSEELGEECICYSSSNRANEDLDLLRRREARHLGLSLGKSHHGRALSI